MESNRKEDDPQKHPFFGSSSSANTSNLSDTFGAYNNNKDNNVSFGATSFGQQQQQLQAPTSAMFGSRTFPSSNPSTGFGSVSKASSPFVTAASSLAVGVVPASSPFGISTTTTRNPFGSTFVNDTNTTTSKTTTFGTAAGFGNVSTSFKQHSSGTSFAVGAPNPFVSSSMSSSIQNPFASSTTTTATTTPASFVTIAGPIATTNIDRQWVRNSNNTNSQPYEQDTVFNIKSSSGTTAATDELARLKAKIEQKKRQLEEQRLHLRKQKTLEQQHKQQQQPQKSDGDFVIPRNQQQQQPPQVITTEQPQPQQNKSKEGITSNKILQERPLFRLLPLDLQPIALYYKPPSMYDAVEEHYDSSSSLVGICKTMCPTEELLRREYENDIPLLEIPHSVIHPPHWTLRDTCVKRFRRSAADYKLDIPSLVRPPLVLEQCVSYLEEWVMERDRQGIDPRFGKVPPSLDVYQFVWDRTRMIRKDFILQNYIGMSANNRGLCSAVAVRCHERIARWHVMMEHQLSHLTEYVIQQSVQNIQELGQTLKTLNQLYDDTLDRSTMPDEEETSGRHGSQSDIVQGSTPIDYDGTQLNNDITSSSTRTTTTRLIGTMTATNSNNGTAEAEMRGLYILLTMHNDGGMEVLKYAASLSIKNPSVFRSNPVQLALSVFRARKEWNYARFFQILRSPSTPYLFACIMFKYVEEMRKVAIYVMSRAYGTRRSKEDGGGVYDKYNLIDLVRLLCFENENEARNACKHYGIFVSDYDRSSNSHTMDDDEAAAAADSDEDSVDEGNSVEKNKKHQGPFVKWRHSQFREPIDPSKGCKIPLKTKKMVRTIESKLHAATRLAVCRGDVSGSFIERISAGAASFHRGHPHLEQQSATSVSSLSTTTTHFASGPSLDRRNLEDAARKQQLHDVPFMPTQMLPTEEAKVSQDDAKKDMERKKQKNESDRLRKIEEMVKQQLELVRKKVQADEEKLVIQQQSRAKAAERAIIDEREKVEEAEKLRIQQQEIIQRRKQLAADLVKKRKLKEEEGRKKEAAQKRIEEEKRQREMERRAQQEKKKRAGELHRQKVEAEREIRLVREEREKIKNEWRKKMSYARKCLAWRLWRRAIIENERQTSLSSIAKIDPTFCGSSNALSISSFISRVLTKSKMVACGTSSLESFFIHIANMETARIDVARSLAARVYGSFSSTPGAIRPVFLFKVMVVMPRHNTLSNNGLYSAILSWVDSRVRFNKTFSHAVEYRSEVRFVLVNGSNDVRAFDGCDAAIFVVPPGVQWSSDSSLFPSASLDVPCRIALVLAPLNEVNPSLSVNLTNELGETTVVMARAHPSYKDEIDIALTLCFEDLIGLYLKRLDIGYGSFERLSLTEMGCQCIRTVLSCNNPFEPLDDTYIAKECLKSLLFTMNTVSISLRQDIMQAWPAREFCNDEKQDFVNNVGLQAFGVPGYFGNGIGDTMPCSWLNLLNSNPLEKSPLSVLLNPSVKTVEDIIHTMKLEGFIMPVDVAQDCELLLLKKDVRRCFESVLLCFEKYFYEGDDTFIYLPTGEMDYILQKSVATAHHELKSSRSAAGKQKHLQFVSASQATVDTTVNQIIEQQPQSTGPALMLSERKTRIISSSNSSDFDDSSTHAFHLGIEVKGRSSKRLKMNTNNKKAPSKEKALISFSKEYEASKSFTADLEAFLYEDLAA